MLESWKYTGKTVNEATEQALRDLEVNLEDIEIRVNSPGRSGIMGLGGKLAEIEVSLIDTKSTPKMSPNPQKSLRKAGTEHAKGASTRAKRGSFADKRNNEHTAQAHHSTERKSKTSKPPVKPFEGLTEHDPKLEKIASETLSELLNLMGLTTEIYLRDELNDGHIVFDLEGEDAGLLIGHYGETLQALQRILRLVLHYKLGHKAYVELDVEGYRGRRLELLRKLALRTIQDAIKTQQPQDLPPMSPADRRIVHMQIADEDRVSSDSEGAGKQRHVVITPLMDTE